MGIAVLLDRPILVLDPGDLRSVSVTADTPQLGGRHRHVVVRSVHHTVGCICLFGCLFVCLPLKIDWQPQV